VPGWVRRQRWIMGLLAAAASVSLAAEPTDEAIEGRRAEAASTWGKVSEDHGEITLGFASSLRRLSGVGWNLAGGDASEVPRLVTANEPFTALYARVPVGGFRGDVRLIHSHVRTTVGFQLLYPLYEGPPEGSFVVGGRERPVAMQLLQSEELRLGLGAEIPVGPVALFADLIGDVQWMKTQLVVDGAVADYSATHFGFRVVAGARLHLRGKLFVLVAGEVGLASDVLFGGQLAVGCSLGG
jgi:hypothetical protein